MLRPSVPVEYRTTQSETTERYFDCRYCGAHAEVAFHAKGDSGWHRDQLFGTEDAEQRAVEAAVEDMTVDAERVLHLIPCPTCGRRDGAYVRWAVIRVCAWLVLAGIVYLFFSEFLSVTRQLPWSVFPLAF